jgi:hypothetical protein
MAYLGSTVDPIQAREISNREIGEIMIKISP